MKKLSFVLMIALAGYMVQGCNNAPKDEKQTADSVNKTKDTTTNAAATGGIAVVSDDAKFATTAAEGGMVEVALGNLAEQKSSNTKIKNFGAMMVTDHGNAGAELASIAKAKNITLPEAISADDQKKIDELSKKSVKDFDAAYVSAMIDGHTDALKLFRDAAKNCQDADLKAFASKTAPKVAAHLEAINEIKTSLK